MKQLTITLILTLLPLMASAVRVCIDDIYYNIDTATKQAEVTSMPSGKYYSGTMTIPEKVFYDRSKYMVTTIGGSAFSGCRDLTSVKIPVSVKTIGLMAFSHCSNLTSITIPNSVTTIRQRAFYNCISLTSISIPNSVKSIGEAVFSACLRTLLILSLKKVMIRMILRNIVMPLLKLHLIVLFVAVKIHLSPTM